MIVFRLLAVFIFTALLTGCGLFGNVAHQIQADVREILRGNPPSGDCLNPGAIQSMYCNYRLVCKNISGDLFQCYVDPLLVKKGEEDCKKIFENKMYDDDPGMILKDFKCPKAEYYNHRLYEVEVVGRIKPENGVPVDLINIPRSDKLTKGHIDVDLNNIPIKN